MSRALLGALILLVVSQPAAAKVPTFPASFQTKTVQTDGAIIYVRVGGQGPAVVMLHGFADTGDMWAPLAAVLAPVAFVAKGKLTMPVLAIGADKSFGTAQADDLRFVATDVT